MSRRHYGARWQKLCRLAAPENDMSAARCHVITARLNGAPEGREKMAAVIAAVVASYGRVGRALPRLV